MYIEPNTTIKILKNVPLDDTYDHTAMFSSPGTQADWFSGKAKYTLDRNSYQRVQRGFMRINIESDNLYDCNYLMFQNTAFGQKWFYAFIKSVEYVNNGVSQIEFEIDVMQTWLFNYEMEECFVEREHSITDNLFEHTIDENLDIGERRVYVNQDELSLNELECIAQFVSDTVTGSNSGNFINVLRYDHDTFENMAKYIQTYVDGGITDKIASIFAFPKDMLFWTGGSGSLKNNIPQGVTKYFEYNENDKFNLFHDIDGYIPKNKKLFTYPYYYLFCTNRLGNSASYKFENFQTVDTNLEHSNVGKQYSFRCEGSVTGSPYVTCFPARYNQIYENYDEGLTITGFPQYSWSSNAYAEWLNRNQNTVDFSLLSATLTSVIQGTSSIALGHPIYGINSGLNLFNQVGSLMSRVKDIQRIPAQSHGQFQGAFYNIEQHIYGYTYYTSTITKEYAQIIDDYFSRFGYACRQNKIPNRISRPEWNYVKTAGCTIRGSIPCDDMRKICDVYNNGITFWRKADNIGRYDLDNSPTGA